jgi:hypothetical protein
MIPNEKGTMACQELEARPEEGEPTKVDRKPEAAEERQVPDENAEVIPVGEPRKKRRTDRKLAAERRRQMKEQTQDNDGCRRRLAVARTGTSNHAKVARKTQADQKMPRRATVARRMRDIFRPNTTHHAKVALRKGIARKNWVMDSVLRGIVTGQTSGRRRQQQRKCNEGIRNQDGEELLHNCGLRRNSKFLRYQRPPEQQTMDWTLWRCRPPAKRKKKNGPCWRNR